MGRPDDLPPAEHYPHGTRARYVAGCRCGECKKANKVAYHELQRRAIEAAQEIETPPVPVGQVWTAPDGTKKVRQYKRACPGVNGAPCPKHSHLRKDSKGGVCGYCRLQLVWNGLVAAEPVRKHLLKLSRRGIGYKAVAAACDVSKTNLMKILNGTKTLVRKSTADRVLAVDRGAIADHSLVPAARTWKIVRRLLEEGFTRSSLAKRLGYKSPALQFRKDFVLASTEAKLLRFYRLIMLE